MYVCVDNKKVLKASYVVSLSVDKQDEAYTIAVKLIKSFTKDLITYMIDEKYASKIEPVPLSDMTIYRRIK